MIKKQNKKQIQKNNWPQQINKTNFIKKDLKKLIDSIEIYQKGWIKG